MDPTKYPTMEQVEAADRVQLGKWMRFLKPPGDWAQGLDTFWQVAARERKVLERIEARFREKGGMTPEISKLIGW